MQLVIVINLLDNYKKVVEAYLCEAMYGGNKRQRQSIREKKMALCMGGKKKEKKDGRKGAGVGGERVGSKVFWFLPKFHQISRKIPNC
jgi:hypothetical protein